MMDIRLLEVYPRVGGGNAANTAAVSALAGLSPRGRGKRPLCVHRLARARSIPAWAGETADKAEKQNAIKVYPRVGGGNAPRFTLESDMPGLSPRGRGKLALGPNARRECRSIPAWAGETAPTIIRSISVRVYPRVGGGNALLRSHSLVEIGLSPRGRGKLRRRIGNPAPAGSIPAWAGETRLRLVESRQ